jgi:hypothetical protein
MPIGHWSRLNCDLGSSSGASPPNEFLEHIGFIHFVSSTNAIQVTGWDCLPLSTHSLDDTAPQNHGELHFNWALREATQLLGQPPHLHCPSASRCLMRRDFWSPRFGPRDAR